MPTIDTCFRVYVFGGLAGQRWHQISQGLFNGPYYGGLEANLQKVAGMKVNLQSNYVGGGGVMEVDDTMKVRKKIENKERYKIASGK